MWAIAAFFEQDGRTNWVKESGVEEAGIMKKYITSLYWAVVTITTVGYGDITPTNKTEYLFALFCIILGVTFHSFIISALSNSF